MAQLGHRALVAVLIAIIAGLAAYAACYKRHFLRLSENMDRIGGAGGSSRFAFLSWLGSWILPNVFERACSSFTAKVLLRNEKHVMFAGAYLGLGLVLIASLVLPGGLRGSSNGIPDAGLLAIPILIAFFVATGLRFAFEMPAELEANWIFRITVDSPGEVPRKAVKKIMLLSTIPWQIGILLPLMAWAYDWRIAIEHTAVAVGVTILTIRGLLIGFRKIPFTCSCQTDVKQYVVRILGCILAVSFLVPLLTALECWAMKDAVRVPVLAALYAGAWYLLAYVRQEAEGDGEGTLFEERHSSALNVLRIY